MKQMTYLEAGREGLAEMMREDKTVWALGEDLGRGGVFGQYHGLQAEFGNERIVDTPISESCILGSAVGAAMMGTRPIVEMRFADFALCAVDELVNQAAQDYIGRVKKSGPHLLHLTTYRLGGHTSTDPASYRPKDEADSQWSNDPIARCHDLLIEDGVSTEQLYQIGNEAVTEMTRVYEIARDASFPPALDAYKDVQNIGDPQTEAY